MTPGSPRERLAGELALHANADVTSRRTHVDEKPPQRQQPGVAQTAEAVDCKGRTLAARGPAWIRETLKHNGARGGGGGEGEGATLAAAHVSGLPPLLQAAEPALNVAVA